MIGVAIPQMLRKTDADQGKHGGGAGSSGLVARAR
jgi:hypothetical protein